MAKEPIDPAKVNPKHPGGDDSKGNTGGSKGSDPNKDGPRRDPKK